MLSRRMFRQISIARSLTPRSDEVHWKLHHIQDEALYCPVSAMDCNVHPFNGTLQTPRTYKSNVGNIYTCTMTYIFHRL